MLFRDGTSATSSQMFENDIWGSLTQAKNEVLNRVTHLGELTKLDLKKKSRPPGHMFTIKVEAKLVKKENPTKRVKSREKRRLSKEKPDKIIPNFEGSPFNVQSKRFVPFGPHPKLGAGGIYKLNVTDVSPVSYAPEILKGEHMEEPMISQHWKANDHYRKMVLKVGQLKEKEALKNQQAAIGPGNYLPSSWLINQKPPKVTGGIWGKSGRFKGQSPFSRIQRGHIHRDFLKKNNVVPGPGNYYKQDPGSCHDTQFEGPETFDWSDGHVDRSDMPIGSDLPPGLYKAITNLEIMDNKQAGNKGSFYQNVSGRDGRKVQGSGHQLPEAGINANDTETYKLPHLGPGRYSPKYAFKERKESFGVKTADQRYMETYKSTKKPRRNSLFKTPGPGSYVYNRYQTIKEDKRTCFAETVCDNTSFPVKARAAAKQWGERYGFSSSTKRRDRFSSQFWASATGPMGPGRYYPQDLRFGMEFDNGHTNVFNSPVERPLSKAIDLKTKETERLKAQFNNKQRRLEIVSHQLKARGVKHDHGSTTILPPTHI